MAEAARRLIAGPVEPKAWAPFGWVPVPDTDPADGAFRLEYEWGDPHANVISHAPDEVERDVHARILDVLVSELHLVARQRRRGLAFRR